MTASCTIKSERPGCLGGVIRNKRLVREKPEGGLITEPQDFPGEGGGAFSLMMQMF